MDKTQETVSEKNYRAPDSDTHFLRKFATTTLLPYFEKANVSPRFLLFFRIFFAFITGLAIILGNWVVAVIFLTIYQFVFILDYIDGPLARRKGEFSPFLNKFDRIAHALTSAFFLMGITLMFQENWTVYVGIAGVLSILASIVIDTFWIKTAGLAEVKKVHKVKGKFFGLYNLLRIDGSFTLFYFLFLMRLFEIDLYALSILNILMLSKKAYNFIIWKSKKKK